MIFTIFPEEDGNLRNTATFLEMNENHEDNNAHEIKSYINPSHGTCDPVGTFSTAGFCYSRRGGPGQV